LHRMASFLYKRLHSFEMQAHLKFKEDRVDHCPSKTL
jgi:hypothetical protein